MRLQTVTATLLCSLLVSSTLRADETFSYYLPKTILLVTVSYRTTTYSEARFKEWTEKFFPNAKKWNNSSAIGPNDYIDSPKTVHTLLEPTISRTSIEDRTKGVTVNSKSAWLRDRSFGLTRGANGVPARISFSSNDRRWDFFISIAKAAIGLTSS
jgi:hypothetical protein